MLVTRVATYEEQNLMSGEDFGQKLSKLQIITKLISIDLPSLIQQNLSMLVLECGWPQFEGNLNSGHALCVCQYYLNISESQKLCIKVMTIQYFNIFRI